MEDIAITEEPVRSTAMAVLRGGDATRTRLLDVAERLFAEEGVHGVSIRDITKEAVVNLAAINYHFGSKMALLQAIFERRLGPINAERECLMADALKEVPPDPAKILEAFIGPTLALGESEGERHFKVLAARASLDPAPEVRKAVFDFYDSVGRSFVASIKAACPQLSREELFWRLACVYGTMLYVRADNGRLQLLLGEDLSMEDPQQALTHIIPFLTAGLTSKANTPLPVANAQSARLGAFVPVSVKQRQSQNKPHESSNV